MYYETQDPKGGLTPKKKGLHIHLFFLQKE